MISKPLQNLDQQCCIQECERSPTESEKMTRSFCTVGQQALALLNYIQQNTEIRVFVSKGHNVCYDFSTRGAIKVRSHEKNGEKQIY